MIIDGFSNNKAAIVLAVFVLAGLFINLGGAPLFDEDEGAYAEVTREMLENRDLLTPRLNGEPFFHKPPMIYWTQSICVSLLGLNEFALRLPSAVASAAWALILFIFVNHYMERRTAWFAVFILLTSLQTNLILKAAIADALLNLFITGALFCAYAYYQGGRFFFLRAAFFCMALGFLTKGPIAIAIPAVSTALFYFSKKKYRHWLKAVLDPLGWLLFSAVTLPWYIALYAAHGSAFIEELFFVHNVGRFLRPMEGHSGTVFYYIPVILIGLMPYTALCAAALGKLGQHWKDDLGRFLLLWFLFVFIFFSLAGTKLHHYIVYGYAPLIIFMAAAVNHLKNKILIVLPAILLFTVLGIAPYIAAMAVTRIDDAFAQIVITSAIGRFGINHILVMGAGLGAIVIIGCLDRINTQCRLVCLGLILTCCVNYYLIPKVADIMQAPVKAAALLAKQKKYDVVMWEMNYPSFNVYYGRQVLRHKPRDGDIVITKANKLHKLHSYTILFQEHGIVLARIERYNAEAASGG